MEARDQGLCAPGYGPLPELWLHILGRPSHFLAALDQRRHTFERKRDGSNSRISGWKLHCSDLLSAPAGALHAL